MAGPKGSCTPLTLMGGIMWLNGAQYSIVRRRTQRLCCNHSRAAHEDPNCSMMMTRRSHLATANSHMQRDQDRVRMLRSLSKCRCNFQLPDGEGEDLYGYAAYWLMHRHASCSNNAAHLMSLSCLKDVSNELDYVRFHISTIILKGQTHSCLLALWDSE